MSIETLKNRIPEFAKDIRINLGRVLSPEGSEGLSESQIFGIALASAYATENKDVVTSVKEAAQFVLSEAEEKAAKSAASIMAMNNVYYRAINAIKEPSYASLPAGLRMQVIGSPGIPTLDFELYSLAVSAINGCGHCLDSHEKAVAKAGISQAGVQSAIRIAAVIKAAALAGSIEE